MHKLNCLLTLGRIAIALQAPTPNAVMLCLISLFVSVVHHRVTMTASTPCDAAATHQTAARFHSQSQGMVEIVNGTFKKLTTFLSYREAFPISWSSATVSRRILYLIYLNDELLNVPLWVMFVIALYCLDLDVLCCYSHDYFDNETIEFLWCYWNVF